jgi:hypothetical protein
MAAIAELQAGRAFLRRDLRHEMQRQKQQHDRHRLDRDLRQREVGRREIGEPGRDRQADDPDQHQRAEPVVVHRDDRHRGDDQHEPAHGDHRRHRQQFRVGADRPLPE